MDREKVISTFEKIISVCKEDGCDFVDISFEDAEQILALLKEQEAVMVHDPGAFCPQCGWMLYPEDHPKFCGNCGQTLKWELLK